MIIVICPGIHQPKLTQEFVEGLNSASATLQQQLLIFPAHNYPAFSGVQILQFLRERLSLHTPIGLISFSAGVVGAIGAAWGWQLLGGQVKVFIALDGWGVPLAGNFPIYRLSHDYFTHWSSSLLGSGTDSFYAEPAVEHLDLWRFPQTVLGWHVTATASGKEQRQAYLSAAEFLYTVLRREQSS